MSHTKDAESANKSLPPSPEGKGPDTAQEFPGNVVEACPACGSLEFVSLFSAGDRLYGTTPRIFQIVECGKCRLIRLHPQPTPEELRTYYPKEYWSVPASTRTDRLENGYRRLVLRDDLHFAERALREVQEQSGEHGIVLDVGCGGGLFLQMLYERGRVQGIGLDFALDAASAAWRHRGVPTVCASLASAPFPPGSCALVTMFQVLEHLYDPASYLRAAHELLAAEGRLVVQVPNAACWQFLLLGEYWSGIEVPRHLVNFRKQDLETLLEEAGFEIIRHKYFSLRDNPRGMAISIAPFLDPTARRLRHTIETPRKRLWKDALFLALVAACLPFTLLEAACHAGSTVMIEARKK